MKIKPEHVEQLKVFIEHLDTPERRQQYINGDFLNSSKTTDVNKRYRWDLVFANPEASRFICAMLYKYSHDEHIDTALRSIVPKLQKL